MTEDFGDQERTLRIIRFFLPRLGREQMVKEIDEEKDRLRRVSAEAIDSLRAKGEAEVADRERDLQGGAKMSMARVAEIQRNSVERLEREEASCRSRIEEVDELRRRDVSAIEERIRNEGNRIRLRLAVDGQRGTRDVLILVGAMVVLILGIAFAVSSESVAPIAIGLALLVLVASLLAGAARSKQHQEAIRSLRERLESLRERIESDVAAERASLQAGLAALEGRIDELLRLYGESIALADEVAAFCNDRLSELRGIVAPALGLQPSDVLDERCAEVWAPTFLQVQSVPDSVLRDADQSAIEIRQLADDIIAPMRLAMPGEEHWQAFRRRILPMLGLQEVELPRRGQDPQPPAGVESSGLNSLRAVRFSVPRQTYLAGHYFFQSIVCAEDMIGLFRAYVNVLNRRLPHTFALQILYSDIAAIGIETAFTRERFDQSRMTIDQHTHTLTLELSSGTSYRMSGDAGSSAQIRVSGDAEVERVMSQANLDFRDQITNVRALIRDAKAARVGPGSGT